MGEKEMRVKRVVSTLLVVLMTLSIIPTGFLPASAAETYYWPVDTSIDYNHNYLYDATAGNSIHGGVDFPCGIGTPVYASAAGTVSIVNNGCTGSHNGQKYAPVCTKTGCPGSFGNYIYVSNSEGRTLYAHLSGFAVSSGAYVEAGQLIGYSGNAGNTKGAHLHFEIQINNKRLTCNPLSVLRRENPIFNSHTVDQNYPRDFTATAKSRIDVWNADHSDPGNRYIDPGDVCTIHEVYTDGCCYVTYPTSSTPQTYYANISGFSYSIVTESPVINRVYWGDNGTKTHIRPVVEIANPETVSSVLFPMWSHNGDGAQNNLNWYGAVFNGGLCWFNDIEYNAFSYPNIECHCYVHGKDGSVQCITLPRSYNKNFVYSLDVNMVIDGERYNCGASGFSFDMYFDGKLEGNDATDWCYQHYFGSSFEIRDIKCPTGYAFTGGTTSGKITSDQEVVLSFTQNQYMLDVNLNIEGTTYYSGCDGFSFDVSINDSLVSNDAADYYQAHTHGTTYKISDIKCPTGYCYTGGTASGTITGSTSVTLTFGKTAYYLTFDTNYDGIRPNLYKPTKSTKTVNGMNYSYDVAMNVMTFNGMTKEYANAQVDWYPFKPAANTSYKVTATLLSGTITGGCIVVETSQSNSEPLSTRTFFDVTKTGSKTWTFTSTTAAEAAILQTWMYNSDGKQLVCDNVKLQIKIEKLSSASDAATAFSPCMMGKHYGEGYSLMTLSRTGYTFDGWYTEKTGGAKVASSTQYPASDQVLYAHWTKNIYTAEIDHWCYGFNGRGTNTPNGNTAIKLATTAKAFTYSSGVSFTENDCLSSSALPNGVQLRSTSFISPSFSDSWKMYNSPQMFNNVDKDVSIEIQYQLMDYSIAYDLDGGTLAENNPSTYNVVFGASFANQPTKKGYTFAGWSIDGKTVITGVNEAELDDSVFVNDEGLEGGLFYEAVKNRTTGNITVKALWTPASYAVKYIGNGSTSGSMNNQSFAYDAAQNLTENAFVRQYTVTFNYNGATGGNSESTATAKATFNGWATSAGGAKVYNDKQSVKNLATGGTYNLYANWTLGTVILPTPIRSGWSFLGWSKSVQASSVDYAAGAMWTPTADCTLYAVWTQAAGAPYWCDLNDDRFVNGSDRSEIANYLVDTATLTAEQKCFGDVNLDGTLDDIDLLIAAQYIDGVINTFPAANAAKYTFVHPTKTEYIQGETLDTAGAKIQIDNSNNTSVSYSMDQNISFAGYDSSVVGKQTITATYRGLTFSYTVNVLSTDYTVKFNGNGSTSGNMSNQTIARNAMQNLSANAFQRKYTVTYNHNYSGSTDTTAIATSMLNGWAKSATGVKEFNDKASVTNLTTDSTITLYANWTLGTVTLPDPTRTGYTFGGWYTDPALTTSAGAAGASYKPTANVTLYAKWTATSYIVNFNGNGSTSGSMSSQCFTYDVEQNLIANAFQRSYTVTYNYNGATSGNSKASDTAAATFNGWATSASGSKIYADKQSVKNLATSGTYNLYANWTLQSVTLPTPTREGYTFGGWYTDSTLTTFAGVAGTSYKPIAPVTLYAKWTAVTIMEIAVATMPVRMTYTVGDTLDAAGLVLTANMSNNTSEAVTSGFICTPTELTTVGMQTITVSYDGITTSFDVTVQEPEAMQNAPRMTLSSQNAKVGECVELMLSVVNNPGIVATSINLIYDKTVLRLVDVKASGMLGRGAFTAGKDLSLVPYTVLWVNGLAEENIAEDGVLAIFTFEVLQTTESGQTTVTLQYEPRSTFNVALDEVQFATENGVVNISNRIPGDVTGDGAVDLKDVVILSRYLAGGWNVQIDESAADANADGSVDLKDVTLIRRYLSGGWNVVLK